MELRTDTEKLSFLLEAEAELADFLADGELSAQAADRPKYITNYIGSKQKLVDWIWSNTPDGVQTVADMFSGSSVVGYMYKSKGELRGRWCGACGGEWGRTRAELGGVRFQGARRMSWVPGRFMDAAVSEATARIPPARNVDSPSGPL